MIEKGKRFTDEEKEIILKYIKDGVEKKETGLSMFEKLKANNIDITKQTVYYYINKIKKEQEETQAKPTIRVFTREERQAKVRKTYHTPAERLYYARGNIIDLKNRGYTDANIAEIYHVQESDVADFFEKRKYVSPEQYREIVYKVSRGATLEDLATEYGVSEYTIRKMLQSNKPFISKEIEQDGETEYELDLDVAKNFIKFINTLMTYKTIRTDVAEKLDAQRQDIFHELEMCDLPQEEKLAMLDKIAEIGRRRREAKDYNKIFEPVHEFLADEDNLNIIKLFANRVAEAINKFKDLDTRVYFIRGE